MRTTLILSSLFILGACSPEAAQAFQQAAQNMAAMENSNQAAKQSFCAYNPAMNAHQKCLHMNAIGQCVHYGAPCI